ncbi:hypothetical protein K0A97_00105 [Patescibacteria group bacterium]|nr:hypothetical protein [Patescibacteria group bacterium]
MNKWIELAGGLVLLIGLILIGWASSVYSWTFLGKDFNLLHSAWIFLKGGIFWLLGGISVILIILGITDLKE